VTTLAGLLFAVNSVAEMRESMERFGRDVISEFT